LRLALAFSLALWALASIICIRSGDQLRYPDETEYNGLALNLTQGKGFVDEHSRPTAFRPPGYPVVLALVYFVSPHPLAAKLLNAFACGVSAFCSR
jgi:hypothetical protein